jgi:hypothetical protein
MEHLDWAFRKILKVPKEELIKEEKRIKRRRKAKAGKSS